MKYTGQERREQDFSPSFGRMLHQRLEIFGARERLMEAVDLCCDGHPMAARDAIEDAIAQIEDGGRRDAEIIDILADFPPVFMIDIALHERRRSFIEKLASGLEWSLIWDGDAVFASGDGGSFELQINPVDAWICTSGMPDVHITGVGLTSLHAHIKGEDLAATMARLAPWYAKILKGGAR